MERTVYIARVSEIFLKGKNRPFFQKALLRNLRICLNENNIKYDLVSKRNRILIYSDDDCSCISNVFGLSNYSKALEINNDLDSLKEQAKKFFKGGTQCVNTKRLDKAYPMTSPQVNAEVGLSLDGECDLKNPDNLINIEIDTESAFIFAEKTECFGGLPIGSEGTVGVFVQSEDALKAAWLVMRRGCDVILFGDKINTKKLEPFAYGSDLEFSDSFPENVPAVVVEDTLDSIQDYEFSVPVLRPLVGYSQKVF